MWDALWGNGKLATMTAHGPFGLIEKGAIAAEDGRIAWVGEESALPAGPTACARDVHDLGGRLLTPGLVDCHNHAVYHGDALSDFELLTQGGSARRHDRGRRRACRAWCGRRRAATDEQLYTASAARVSKLIASGMTTLESKSGAGLDLQTELRCLRIAREIGRKLPVRIVTTFLGAHGVAPEYRGRPGRLYRSPLPRHPAGRGRAGARGSGRRVLRSDRILARADHAAVRGRQPLTACP